MRFLQRPPEPDKEKDGTKIPNELIVTLKSGSGIDIEELAKNLGAEIVGEIEGLDIYRLRFENEQLTEKARTLLEQDEGVASVGSNLGITPPDTLSPVGLSAPPLNLRPSAADEDGVVIGLIDSSVQRDGSRVGEFLLPEISMAGEAVNRPDQVNHGTSMAETILSEISSKEALLSKGATGRKRVLDRFSLEGNADDFLSVYERAINGPKPQGTIHSVKRTP